MMEADSNTGESLSCSDSLSFSTFQSHNLDTVVEENEDARKARNLKSELLVEDSTKSQLSFYLDRLLQRFIHQCPDKLEISQFDILLMAMYCISLETGFIPWGHRVVEEDQQTFRARYPSFDRRVLFTFSTLVPSNFYNRTSRSYRLNLYLQGSEHQCVLVGIRSGDFLCTTFSVPKRIDVSGRSILLPVARYVPVVNLPKLNLSCQNLKELSAKLKNNIFLPIRDELCIDAKIIMYPSLNGLPDEVVAILLQYLDKKAALRVAASCSRLRTLALHYRRQLFS
ncbi:protein nutcracker [Sabethes cyaneus]|uniref:protein nutcracker n=1 Tax=Sabethes cyaneus TaxID=53552 RepID=UPI00237DE7E2|nr:protein nutcracker [Sabethes cyaneus]